MQHLVEKLEILRNFSFLLTLLFRAIFLLQVLTFFRVHFFTQHLQLLFYFPVFSCTCGFCSDRPWDVFSRISKEVRFAYPFMFFYYSISIVLQKGEEEAKMNHAVLMNVFVVASFKTTPNFNDNDFKTYCLLTEMWTVPLRYLFSIISLPTLQILFPSIMH